MTQASEKISKRPQKTFGKRLHSTLDTPAKISECVSKTLLLSPAFSSPQPREQPISKRNNVVHGSYFYHTSAYESPLFSHAAKLKESLGDGVSEPFNKHIGDPFNEPFADVFIFKSFLGSKDSTNQKVKKQKKVRSGPSESNFSLESSEKPPYSYATLIGMSILSNPGKQLTLSQIYSWISNTFKYYRREDVGWQNSIRHNLSLNKAFVKGQKSKDGKGHFWCIQEDSEDLFLKAKNNKKSSYYEVMDQLASEKKCPYSLVPSSPTSLAEDDCLQSSAAKIPLLSTFTRRDPVESRLPIDEITTVTEEADVLSLHRTPGRILTTYDSLDKPLLGGNNFGFTSSFSCSSNFERSPLSAHGTGPLLEPLSPQGTGFVTQNLGNLSVRLPTISVSQTNFHHQPQPFSVGHGTPKAAGEIRTTPKNCKKKSFKVLRTPLSGATLSKLRNSPSYLEDFYHSPFMTGRALLNSYDDDDMLSRAFDSPSTHQPPASCLLGELKKATLEHSDESVSKSHI